LWGVLHAPGRARHVNFPSRPMNDGKHWGETWKPSVLLVWSRFATLTKQIKQDWGTSRIFTQNYAFEEWLCPVRCEDP
jgi:hypothetical protein